MDARLLAVAKAVVVQVVDVCHVDGVLKHTCAGQQQQQMLATNTACQEAVQRPMQNWSRPEPLRMAKTP